MSADGRTDAGDGRIAPNQPTDAADPTRRTSTTEDPAFLRIDEILRIHKDQIHRYGGDDGLHEGNVLLSASAMPQATFDGNYLHGDLCEMAAAYLFHLVQNHPFREGNKRTGAAAALVFLDLNGVEIEASEDELVELLFEVARGNLSKWEVAEFFRERRIRPRAE